jgi:septation ring formation regulator EzrA
VANVNIKHWEELIHAGRSNIASWQQDIAKTSAEADAKRKEQKPSMNKLASLKAERSKKAHQIIHRASVIEGKVDKLQERLNKIQVTKPE